MPGCKAAPGHPQIPFSGTRARALCPCLAVFPCPCSSPPHQLCLPIYLTTVAGWGKLSSPAGSQMAPGHASLAAGMAGSMGEQRGLKKIFPSLLSSLGCLVLFPCCGLDGPNIMISEKVSQSPAPAPSVNHCCSEGHQ